MKTTQDGFTLIELMIVIAILGILAAIAIPSYQDYSIRAKIAEAIHVSSAAKANVSDYYWANNVFPNSRFESGTSNVQTKYVSELTILNNGVISINIDESSTGLDTQTAETMFILLTPTAVTGSFDWFCSSNNAVDGSGDNITIGRYAPASCR